MNPLAHGSILLSDEQPVPEGPAEETIDANDVHCPEASRFDYLFPELQKSTSDRLPDILPGNASIAETLIKLGNKMTDPEPKFPDPADPKFDSTIPSVYTYFGQFITHEIVFGFATVDRKVGPDTIPVQED